MTDNSKPTWGAPPPQSNWDPKVWDAANSPRPSGPQFEWPRAAAPTPPGSFDAAPAQPAGMDFSAGRGLTLHSEADGVLQAPTDAVEGLSTIAPAESVTVAPTSEEKAEAGLPYVALCISIHTAIRLRTAEFYFGLEISARNHDGSSILERVRFAMGLEEDDDYNGEYSARRGAGGSDAAAEKATAEITRTLHDASGQLAKHYCSLGFRPDLGVGVTLDGNGDFLLTDGMGGADCYWAIVRREDFDTASALASFPNVPSHAEAGEMSMTEVGLHSHPDGIVSIMTDGPIPADWLNAELAKRERRRHWFLPDDGQSTEDWCESRAIPTDKLNRSLRRWLACGQNFSLFAKTGTAEERAGGEQARELKAVVPGLLFEGLVHIVCGQPGTGKTTMMFELMAKLCGEGDGSFTFLGMPIERKDGEQRTVIFFSGEEPEEMFTERQNVFAPRFGLPLWAAYAAGDLTLDGCMSIMEQAPPGSLIVFDPADTFLSGSMLDPGSANDFLAPLVAVAARRSLCVVLMTHTTKGNSKEGSLKTMDDLRAAYAGAGTWLQRARMMIGLILRMDGLIEVGIAKTNLPPQHLTFVSDRGSRVFRRNADTLCLDPVAPSTEAGKPKSGPQDDELAGRITDAVNWVRDGGGVVRRTGSRSLFSLRCPSLEGVSRAAVERTVKAMLAEGVLTEEDEEGIAVSE